MRERDMIQNTTPTIDSLPSVGFRRRVLWIGSATGLELGLARTAIGSQADVIDAENPQAAVTLAGNAEAAEITPVFAVLASDRPGRFTLADVLGLSRAWPLMPIVSVAASLVDGRRRSGPQLPGIEEVPWHDLPSRCGWWLAAFESGLPSSLGLPTATRREERLLDSMMGLKRRGTANHGRPAMVHLPPIEVSVAASHGDDLEGLCDLLTLAGHPVANRQLGRPQLDETAAALVWDVRDLTARDIEWLRLLAANRPRLFIVMLDSFPRGDTVLAALRAGAAAILGRPVSLEALAGALLSTRTAQAARATQAASAGHVGLGEADRRR